MPCICGHNEIEFERVSHYGKVNVSWSHCTKCNCGIGFEVPDEMRQIAEPNTILRVETGSSVYGLSVEDTDRDEIGVCCEPPHYVVGLGHFEQWEYRDAMERRKVERLFDEQASFDAAPPKSQPGDLDLIVYSLRKWCRMALKGNPSAMMLLYSPKVTLSTPAGLALRELAPAFASKRVGRAFLGYMKAQRQRLAGERGKKDVNRPELVAKYGFDTKYAYHILRLGYQGQEFLFTGALSLPMTDPVRQHLLDVRNGLVPLPDVLEEASRLEAAIQKLLPDSPLPDDPATELVSEFVVDTYREVWGWQPEQLVRNGTL